MTRAHAVIGTAGHVDHGKTSLVQALTGVDCDRLAEEKRRGITIELGFARWQLGSMTASIIDVPGHERFVQTMVAGASGIDLVLLVVAADDGVMPQTREHLAICDHLGVPSGIVVVTKSDLVDEEMLELVEEEIASVTAGTFLEGAPVVRCSARSGAGLDALARAVETALASLRAPPCEGPPWLSVDRAFSKHGFGTIVTGTLVHGAIAVEDELELMPAGRDEPARVVVRGMFVHESAVDRATATTRLALNLRGADRALASRGSVLTRPSWQRPTRSLDLELTLFADAPPIGPRTDLVLHAGTGHATGHARALEPARIAPGERGVFRFVTDAPLVTFAGQRVVVRRPELGAHRTVAGGTILDPHPGRSRVRRRAGAGATVVPSLSRARAPADLVRAMVESSPGATLGALRMRLPLDAGVDAVVAELVSARALVAIGSGAEQRLFSPAQLERVKAGVLETVRGFHRDHAALSGATAADLEGRQLPRLRALTSRAVADLVAAGVLTGGERVRLPAHDPRALHDRVAKLYEAGGLAPDSDELVRHASGLEARVFRDILAELDREGRLARLADGMHFHETALDDVRRRVATYFATHETLSPVDFKSLCGLTRKHAIVLLEWLDRQGVTRREGDVRVRVSA